MGIERSLEFLSTSARAVYQTLPSKPINKKRVEFGNETRRGLTSTSFCMLCMLTSGSDRTFLIPNIGWGLEAALLTLPPAAVGVVEPLSFLSLKLS